MYKKGGMESGGRELPRQHLPGGAKATTSSPAQPSQNHPLPRDPSRTRDGGKDQAGKREKMIEIGRWREAKEPSTAVMQRWQHSKSLGRRGGVSFFQK